jgi:alginate O-acetyltransferase complex protein AlgI
LIFNSLPFAILFLVVIFLCAVLPRQRVWILLIASFVFYSWISWYFGIILFLMSVCGYLFPALGRSATSLVVCIIAILSPLLVLKYWNFTADTIQYLFAALGVSLTLVHIAQPIPPGISFHSFQLISYVVDVYRGRSKAEWRPGIFFLFSSFFPQLVAGPIERPNHLVPQLPNAGLFNRDDAASAFQLFLYGLFLKVAIADPVGIKVDQIYNAASQSGSVLLAGTILFYVQIYCDFCGYSMMALGVARALGVDLVQNFNAPMAATSLSDFWHRWHISLSQWFRDYVYIPLGGSKLGIPRWAVAVMVTFLLSGLWHGANWTFVIWGGLHGVGLVVSTLSSRIVRVPVVLGWVLTQVFVTLTWVFFRAADMSQALGILTTIGRDFLVTGQGWTDALSIPQSIGIPPFVLTLGLLVLFWIARTDRAVLLCGGTRPLERNGRALGYLQKAVMATLIAAALLFGSVESRPFIYFQF